MYKRTQDVEPQQVQFCEKIDSKIKYQKEVQFIIEKPQTFISYLAEMLKTLTKSFNTFLVLALGARHGRGCSVILGSAGAGQILPAANPELQSPPCLPLPAFSSLLQWGLYVAACCPSGYFSSLITVLVTAF